MLDFYVKTGIRFSLRDKRLFEITEVEIMRVNCIWSINQQLTSSETLRTALADRVLFCFGFSPFKYMYISLTSNQPIINGGINLECLVQLKQSFEPQGSKVSIPTFRVALPLIFSVSFHILFEFALVFLSAEKMIM